LKNNLPTDPRLPILDIGCGFGQMLAGIRSLGYENLHGIDISEDAVEHGRSLGLNISKIETLDRFFQETTEPAFELAIMSHVLEHIEKHKIIDTLRSIKEKILKPGGSLLVAVPNAQSNTDCYWAYEDFTHTTIFTAGSLYYVLRCAGFENVTFLDPGGIEDFGFLVRSVKRGMQSVYKLNRRVWNFATSGSYHLPSPQIYTYDIKALAK